ALLLQRSVDRARSTWLDAKAAIEMATIGGCFAFAGPQQIGEIREGARADLVFYDLNSLDLCPANDVLQQLVFAERGRSIQRVMVDGKTVYSGGASTNPEIDDALNVVRDFRRIHRGRHPEAYGLADEPPVEFYGSSGTG
ncbi:MAG: amidohydrolase family protein, partial [Pseudomonadota bacterium]